MLANHLVRDGEHCDPFTFAGNGRGQHGAVYDTGRLPRDWANTYTARRHLITYTVLSYGTPVGWVDSEAGWVVPDEKYSVTTSRFQHVLRVALTTSGIDYQE
jgi:hypothetical protein